MGQSRASGGDAPEKTYFGFDKNDYPGDSLLPALHRSFSYAGYWLNNPPGAGSNSWAGKRATLKANGFGFMILYNGRLDAQLTGKDAAALGRADAAAAISAAKKEGFAPGAILFLDQEEGGRLLPEQSAYLFSWIEAIRGSQYRPGVYCSGIPVAEGSSKITTAGEILSHEGNRQWLCGCLTTGARRLPAAWFPGNLFRQLRVEFRKLWSGNTCDRPAPICPPMCRDLCSRRELLRA